MVNPMETDPKQIINSSKNIYLIPSQEPEAISCTLALFYTLKEMGKNVNLVLDEVPNPLKFLTPSLDFISYPKNFVVSIPNKIANVSQIYYEKNEEALKIHLTVESGAIKKESLAFYYAESKPDLIITIGIQDYQKQLEEKLNSFGFLLDSPIMDIDNKTENKKFGKINIIEAKPLTEILSFAVNKDSIKKEPATCLLTSLIVYTDDFKKNLTAEIFEWAGFLMKKGADLKAIKENLNL